MIFGNLKNFFLFFSISTMAGLAESRFAFCSCPDTMPYDIIISEIMADPVPSIALPEIEYIELYNLTDDTVNLLDWSLTFGSHSVTLPEFLLMPGEYQVITDIRADSVPEYNNFIKLNIPAITNTGQVIILQSPEGTIIHSVDFEMDWYNNKDKDDGGWSLEIIDPENPCGARSNWRASNNQKGGTPGQKNSVYSVNPDITSPLLLNVSLCSDTCLILRFNESLDFSIYSRNDLYSVNNGFYHPDRIISDNPLPSLIKLYYNQKFTQGIVYTLTLRNELKDCSGNHLVENVFARFTICEPVGKADIVINEVLFNSDNEAEYVELYNRSDKSIDLSGVLLSLAGINHSIYKTVLLSDLPYSLFPGNFVVLTQNTENLVLSYANTRLQAVLEVSSLFTLPDDEGIIVLSDTAGNLVDELYYNSDRHLTLLSDFDGMSLERVSPEMTSDDPSNWHTASATSGFGTPGFINSQFCSETTSPLISLLTEVLSPDADGTDDEIILRLAFDEPGWIGTIRIFNMKGSQIKTLISNSLLGTSEYISWDGSDENGHVMETGLYLLYAELFNTNGEIKNFKKVIPVVSK